MASNQAKQQDKPLVVIFILSPQDYIAHDRSARRIDFTLRNLSKIKVNAFQRGDAIADVYAQEALAGLNIPLLTVTHTPRRTLPSRALSIATSIGCSSVFANIEYEVDELRRDIHFCDLAKKDGVKATFVHNKCTVEPGVVLTKENKAYAVCQDRPN